MENRFDKIENSFTIKAHKKTRNHLKLLTFNLAKLVFLLDVT